MKKQTYFYILIILLLTSCSGFQELDIGKVNHYQFLGFKDNKLNFNLTFAVDNPNRYKIIISEINLYAYINDRPLGIVEMNDKLIIEKNSKKDYIVPINIKITNLMGSFSLLSNPNDIISKLSFDGYIKARKGIIFSTIKIDKETSKQYIRF